MEGIDSSPLSPNPRKRAALDEDSPERKPLNLKGTQFMMTTPPDTDQSSNASPTCPNDATARPGSPAPSSSTLSSVEIVASNPAQSSSTTGGPTQQAVSASSSSVRPAKRRKLTVAEKEQQRQEKDAKEAEKAEQKAQREEKKRVEDEKKRKKAEEREGKRREKDLGEERKAQERLRKERSQMRLGAWFGKPATPAKPSADDEERVITARRKSLSLEPFDAVADQIRLSASPCKSAAKPAVATELPTPAKPDVSDYQKHFLPFQLQTYSSIFTLQAVEDPETAQEAFDHSVNDESIREKYDLGLVDAYASLERQFADERQLTRGQQFPSMRQLVDQIQGSIQQPIDLTGDLSLANPMETLQAVSRRYLGFREDVRPPYFGSYTKISSPRTSRRLRRNPFSRGRKDTDYEDDSEAEWEEPEEGEELLGEDEDDEESVGDANEMAGFLDDEEDAVKNKRKMITGDLVPCSTGICWEDEAGKIIPSSEGGSPSQAMRDMRIGTLLPGFSGCTIDPFSTEYWRSDPTPAPQPAPAAEPTLATATGLMAPPRPPLQPRQNTNTTLDQQLVGAAEGMKGPINSIAATPSSKSSKKASPKVLSKEDLEEFKEAVVGSQLSKADLQKGLKARSPKLTNDTIKSTLSEQFAQVGATKADKKWMFVSVS